MPPSPKTDTPISTPPLSLNKLRNIKDITRELLAQEKKNEQRIDINEENIQVAWQKAINRIAEGKTVFLSALQDCAVEYEGFDIKLLATAVCIDFLRNSRLDLLDHFKRYYQNDEINVLFLPKPEDPNAPKITVLSTKEKFELIAQKYPMLRLLKEQLNLELEL